MEHAKTQARSAHYDGSNAGKASKEENGQRGMDLGNLEASDVETKEAPSFTSAPTPQKS